MVPLLAVKSKKPNPKTNVMRDVVTETMSACCLSNFFVVFTS
jgi:hypothetical protein